MARKKLSFEEALAQLGSSVTELEQDSITLDDAVEQFEIGVKAVKDCRSALSRAEGKITKLFAGADGEFIEKSLGISMESLTGGDQ